MTSLLMYSLAMGTLALALAADRASAADGEPEGRPAIPRSPEKLQFNRDIRPIFADTCFKCHGFDKASRKGDLRLDVAEEAFKPHDNGTPIVPGHPEKSEAYTRLTSTDPEEMMPPLKSKVTLTAGQKELVRKWIEQGAEYQPHWAFIPVRRPAVPAVKKQGWVKTDVDKFVLAKLEAEGLPPSPEADKPTVIRRVTLDLTGLPPTPAEVGAFVNDSSPDAYEKVVDRLLASPHYGERMASDWLDLARFADTHGYQADRYRAMWPYRDWVIRAFNQDLPYDQFGTWQLAGDLLPHATKEQRLATAFNRLHMQNEEGGIVEEEFRVAYVNDRVDTFGTAFLGLTVACAHCHDHKFDPITQKEFYSLFSFFQNIDESGQTPYFVNPMPVPTLLLSDDATDAKLADLRAKIEEAGKRAAALREQALKGEGSAAEAFAKALAGPPPAPGAPVGLFNFESLLPGDKVANDADPAKPGIAVDHPKIVAGKHGNAAELTGDNGFKFPGIGHFSRIDPFSLALWLQTPSTDAPRQVIVHHSMAPIDAGSRGYELLLENGRVAFGLHHMWPRNSLKVVTKLPVATSQWAHVAVTYDGSSRAAGVRIYLDGVEQELETVRDGLTKDITYGGKEPDLAVGYRFRDNGFKGGRVDEFRVYDRALTPLEAAQLAGRSDVSEVWDAPAEKLTAARRASLLDYFLATASPEAKQLASELHALRQRQRDLIEPIPEVMVMEETAQPKPAYLLKRGQYDAHGEEVFAGTPGFLPPFPADQPRNRLGLSRWLFSPDHPLTARVEVNRLWQQLFGKGLVETSENFGSQGSFPTHPELLDWLAAEFSDGGWDIKRTLRLIATSATYRQSSRATEGLLARDPADDLLARAPARRLTAEMIRDQALADSGLLVDRIGGPSVKPYQPDGLWQTAMNGPGYDQGHGEDLHRRSLYTFWKRSVPHPALVMFDAADRSYCTARRQSTSTPLQALALLNDVQITEAAKFVSLRMCKEGGETAEARVSWAFRVIAGREPSPRQQEVLMRLYGEQREAFAADPAAADKLLNVGEAKLESGLDKLDLAAGTVLAEALFNFDDAIMRR